MLGQQPSSQFATGTFHPSGEGTPYQQPAARIFDSTVAGASSFFYPEGYPSYLTAGIPPSTVVGAPNFSQVGWYPDPPTPTLHRLNPLAAIPRLSFLFSLYSCTAFSVAFLYREASIYWASMRAPINKIGNDLLEAATNEQDWESVKQQMLELYQLYEDIGNKQAVDNSKALGFSVAGTAFLSAALFLTVIKWNLSSLIKTETTTSLNSNSEQSSLLAGNSASERWYQRLIRKHPKTVKGIPLLIMYGLAGAFLAQGLGTRFTDSQEVQEMHLALLDVLIELGKAVSTVNWEQVHAQIDKIYALSVQSDEMWPYANKVSRALFLSSGVTSLISAALFAVWLKLFPDSDDVVIRGAAPLPSDPSPLPRKGVREFIRDIKNNPNIMMGSLSFVMFTATIIFAAFVGGRSMEDNHLSDLMEQVVNMHLALSTAPVNEWGTVQSVLDNTGMLVASALAESNKAWNIASGLMLCAIFFTMPIIISLMKKVWEHSRYNSRLDSERVRSVMGTPSTVVMVCIIGATLLWSLAAIFNQSSEQLQKITDALLVPYAALSSAIKDANWDMVKNVETMLYEASQTLLGLVEDNKNELWGFIAAMIVGALITSALTTVKIAREIRMCLEDSYDSFEEDPTGASQADSALGACSKGGCRAISPLRIRFS